MACRVFLIFISCILPSCFSFSGFLFHNNRRNVYQKASSNSGLTDVVSSSPAVFGRWEEVHGNYLLRPRSESQPIALIHFLGGAVVGAAPDLTYRYLLEKLSEAGYLIVATPYDLSFNYLQTCDVILEKFERIAPDLARQYGPIPVIGVGHSCGALLQLLISSLFPDTPRAGNVMISFNNKPVSDAVPLFEEVVSPFFTAVAGSNSTDDDDLNGVRGLELLLQGAKITLDGELPSDELLTLINRILTPPPLSSVAPKIIVPSIIRSTLTSTLISPTSGTLRETGLLPVLQQTLLMLDQIPSLIQEVADGVRDFTPSSSSIATATKRAYRARRTLLIQYEDDTFDETPKVESLLLEAEKIMRMKRPSKPNMDLQLKTLQGVHATPLLAPFGTELADKAENLLGESTAKENLFYKNTDQTVEVLKQWLQDSLT